MSATTRPRYMSLKTAAAEAEVSIDTLKAAIQAGDLRAKRTGKPDKDGNPTGHYRISVTALDDWFEQLEDA